MEEEANDPSYSEQFLTALNDFYHDEVIDLVDQNIQMFQSFTYGEMTIATLLLIAICLYVLKWMHEVVR